MGLQQTASQPSLIIKQKPTLNRLWIIKLFIFLASLTITIDNFRSAFQSTFGSVFAKFAVRTLNQLQVVFIDLGFLNLAREKRNWVCAFGGVGGQTDLDSCGSVVHNIAHIEVPLAIKVYEAHIVPRDVWDNLRIFLNLPNQVVFRAFFIWATNT